MSTVKKSAIAAAALALQLVGCGTATTATSRSPTTVASTSSAPVLTAIPDAVFPESGELAIGRHAATVEGASFTFGVRGPGWIADRGRTWAKIDKDGVGEPDGLPDGAAVLFWSPDGVYLEPCGHVRGQPVGPGPDDLVTALSAIPGTEIVTAPTAASLGGRPATHLVLAISEHAECAADQFYLWYDTVEAYRWATALGDTIRMWIVDVRGARLVIEAETRKHAGSEVELEVGSIVDSIQFE